MPLTRPTTTPLPDEIYDEWAPQLGEAELKVLLYIVRRTLGFRKEADAISLSQFTRGIRARDGHPLDRGCGVTSRRHIVRALTGLETKGLIRATKGQSRSGSRAVTVYALWWEGDADDTRGVGGIPWIPGGAPGTPGWCSSGTAVVAQGNQGSAPRTPTTNSRTTHRQQDSETTVHASRPGMPDDRPSYRDIGTDCLWCAVLADIRTVVTPGNYAAWFADTRLVTRNGMTLQVAAPTLMQQQWLDLRLRHQVEKALRRLGYDDITVTFTVAS